MKTKKSATLQDILDHRQRSEFVGRENQLAHFRRNLEYPLDDARRRFIFNVSGQGGVGKTWLLRRWGKIAKAYGAITAYTNQDEDNIPNVLDRLDQQFTGQGHPLKSFTKRYHIYYQHRQEIETDSLAPQGFPHFVEPAQHKGRQQLTYRVPTQSTTLADLADTGPGNEFASYVAHKIDAEDEVRLVLQPVKELTSLFLQDLEAITAKHLVTFFFDTYEQTGTFLDFWLREIVAGKYGPVSANVLLAIAGSDGLGHNDWAPFEELITHLPLKRFTKVEGRICLIRQGITDGQEIETILRLSNRLPLLTATLAVGGLVDPRGLSSSSNEVVECFLTSIKDPHWRQVVLNAALPRYLNRDVLALLTNNHETETILGWLQDLPFVEQHLDTWIYHPVWRAQMLRYKRTHSFEDWLDWQTCLANYYEKQRDDLGLNKAFGCQDKTWRRYALETLYHRLCQIPPAHLPVALNDFVMMLRESKTFAYRWAEAIHTAGIDAAVEDVQNRGFKLMAGIQAHGEGRHQAVVDMFTALLTGIELEVDEQIVVLANRGEAYRQMEQYAAALSDFDQAIELETNDTWTIARRGATRLSRGEYLTALTDFERALALNPNNAWTVAHRGLAYRRMKKHQAALADFERAIALDGNNAWAVAQRGETYRQTGRYPAALADFERALELDPDNDWVIAHRGETQRSLKEYRAALADFDQAIELNPRNAWAIASRAETYRHVGHYQAALADFDWVLELDPDNEWVAAHRGATYQLSGKYPAALADFDRAIELDPDYAWAMGLRGETYRLMGEYSAALADFDRVIAQRLDDARAIVHRGETYLQMGEYSAALADFKRALELDPENAEIIAKWGETHLQMGKYSTALTDFNQALRRDPDNCEVIVRRGETYLYLGDYSAALADFNQAVALNSNDTWAMAHRGEAYRLMKDYRAALFDFDHALELKPDDTWTMVRRGKTRQMMGEYSAALADFDRVLELAPDEAAHHYHRGLLRLTMSTPDQARINLSEAVRLAGRVDKESPQNRGNTFDLALYHLAMEQVEDAERLYQEALTGQVSAYLIRAAIQDLDDLLALFPDHPQARAMRQMLQEHLES